MHFKIFNLYLLTGQLLPIYPVYVLLFQSKGLSLIEISTLFMVWSIPGLVLEVPSSLLADKWNRRNLLVIGRMLKVLCFVIWALSGDFFGFAVGFVLWGSGGALTSGTNEAWLFDALKAEGMENEYDKKWGRGMFYAQMAVAVSAIVGSLIAAYNMQLTLWLSVVIMLISTAFAICLPEFNHNKGLDSQGWKQHFKALADGASFCLTYRHIPLMIGFSVSVLITAGVIDEYDQLIAKSMSVPLSLIGTWLMIRYCLEAIGNKIAWRISSFFKRIHINSTFDMQIYLALVSGLMLCLTALFPLIILLPLYGVYYLLMASAKVLFTDSIQQSIENQGRATVQSLASMLEAPGGILIYMIFGGFGQTLGIQAAIFAISIWIFVLSLLFLYKYSRS